MPLSGMPTPQVDPTGLDEITRRARRLRTTFLASLARRLIHRLSDHLRAGQPLRTSPRG